MASDDHSEVSSPVVRDPKKSIGILTLEKPASATSIKYCSYTTGAQLPSTGALKVLPRFIPLPICSTIPQEEVCALIKKLPSRQNTINILLCSFIKKEETMVSSVLKAKPCHYFLKLLRSKSIIF